MSVNLSIKDVPDALAARLRERAARNHRSMQRELMAIVESAVLEPKDAARSGQAGPPSNADQPGSVVFVQSGKNIEQTAAELRARWPQPHGGGPRAVDIIRADRDSR